MNMLPHLVCHRATELVRQEENKHLLSTKHVSGLYLYQTILEVQSHYAIHFKDEETKLESNMNCEKQTYILTQTVFLIYAVSLRFWSKECLHQNSLGCWLTCRYIGLTSDLPIEFLKIGIRSFGKFSRWFLISSNV